MRTVFLHPPSFDGYDGGAGTRYHMKPAVHSFDLTFDDIVPELANRDLAVMHTSTPSRTSDLQTTLRPGTAIAGGAAARSASNYSR
jgi:hypothetical protein